MKKMSSRERVRAAINHKNSDRVPIDLGAIGSTGIQAGALSQLRDAYKLEKRPVKITEPFQLLGEVEEDVRTAVQADLVGIWSPYTFFGYKNEKWKPWHLSDGTEVLVGGGFRTEVDEKGNTYLFPGNSKIPRAIMPKGGFYFDALLRQEPVDEDDLDGKRDFKDMFSVYSDDELKSIQDITDDLYKNTDYSLVGCFGGMALGDVALLPGLGIEYTPGIRKVEDWYMAHYLHPSYIKEIFDYQTEIAVENLKLYMQAVGDKIDIIHMSGTDFGTQKAEVMSVEMFCEFYKPYHKKANDIIHKKTNWKTSFHSCGSITNLMDDFVDMGVDILNPVQCSAAGMDPVWLKEKYGDKLVFWGGAIDTQHTLAYGTPEEVFEEATNRLEIFSPGGGFIYNAIHNIQQKTPVENIIAFFEAAKRFNDKKQNNSSD